MIKSAGEFVKLLSSIMDPFREDHVAIPSLDIEVQDALACALYSKLQMLEETMKGLPSSDLSQETEITESIVFLSRLLQFELGFVHDWKSSQKELMQKLLFLEYRMALVCSLESYVS